MRTRRTAARAARVVGVLALAILAGAIPAAAAGSAPTCPPGSGRQLAGKHITTKKLQRAGLSCANLSGADLRGFDFIQDDLTGVLATNANFEGVNLGQADLSGAVLRGAKFAGADLTQATLTRADFTGADLNHAHMIQAEAEGVNLTGANLSNADLTQATLNNANLSQANVDGADFTQAELDNVDLDGIRGLHDLSRYLLLGAATLFVLLAVPSLHRVLRRGPKPRGSGIGGPMAMPPAPIPPAPMPPVDAPPVGMAPVVIPTAPGSVWAQAQAQSAASSIFGRPGYPRPAFAAGMPAPATNLAALGGFNPINGPQTRGRVRGVILGQLGSLLAAFGAHLFAGSILGQVSYAFEGLATHACSGPQCAVGISSGTWGVWVGILVAVFGFGVRASA